MGDEADVLMDIALSQWEEDESSMDKRMELLAEGKHSCADGTVILIRKMKDSHLRNAIRYGRMNENKDVEEYWNAAVPLFLQEQFRRFKVPK